MIKPVLTMLGMLAAGKPLSKEELITLAHHVRFMYDAYDRQEAELITLRERVRLLKSENEFLTGMLQEE